jgi:hypothetical protein
MGDILMKTLSLPYGKEYMTANIPEYRHRGEMVSGLHSYKAEMSQWDLVGYALANPVAAPLLHVMAQGKRGGNHRKRSYPSGSKQDHCAADAG